MQRPSRVSDHHSRGAVRWYAAKRKSASFALMSVCMAVAAACTSAAAHSSNGERRNQPVSDVNIVLVLTDDLTANLIPYMPHVVAMERSGTTFPNYIVDESLCCPSRTSMLTGAYPHDTQILSNLPPTGGYAKFHDLGWENHTFATSLSTAGYRTALMGKYLNGYSPTATVDGQAPFTPPGWSEWDVAGNAYNNFNYDLTQNGSVQSFGDTPDAYLNAVLDTRAQSFITDSAAANQPFLLEVAPFSPHTPYTPAPGDLNSFPGLQVPRTAAFNKLPTNPPPWLTGRPPLTAAQIQSMDQDYTRRVEAVQSVDRLIGDLQRTIAETDETARTVFVFTSDNGYHMGEHRLLSGKLTAFDTDIRVPLVLAGAGIPVGVRNPALVQNLDLAPTFERIAHAPVPPTTDGRSLLPLLGPAPPAKWPTLALVEERGPITAHTENPRRDPDFPTPGSGNPPTYQAIRSATFTYVRYAEGAREYYDVRTDPAELHNIYSTLTTQRRQQLNQETTALVNCHNAAACQKARYVPNP